MYLFIFLFLLMGNIRYLILFMSLIFVHEIGHFLTALLLGWKVGEIHLYPYGGMTKLNEKINVSLKEEFLVLGMGPIFQTLFFFLMMPILEERYQSIFKSYHFFILFFNLLPIYPLDGGRLLNLILSEVIPFKKSLVLSVKLSYLVIVISCLFLFQNSSYFLFLVFFFFIIKLQKEKRDIPFVFSKFLLERRLYHFTFPKRKKINLPEEMMRDTLHFFKKDSSLISEKEFLNYLWKKER